jgi:hypothetical protein
MEAPGDLGQVEVVRLSRELLVAVRAAARVDLP